MNPLGFCYIIAFDAVSFISIWFVAYIRLLIPKEYNVFAYKVDSEIRFMKNIRFYKRKKGWGCYILKWNSILN